MFSGGSKGNIGKKRVKRFCKIYKKAPLFEFLFNPLSANPTKWSNTLKQFVGKLTNCLSVFDHFVGLVLKELRKLMALSPQLYLKEIPSQLFSCELCKAFTEYLWRTASIHFALGLPEKCLILFLRK